MIRRLALGALLVVSSALGATAQDTIHLRDPGPGGGPQVLVRALATPYLVIPPATTRALLGRDTPYARTVIVLGRDVVVEGAIHGDVIVVGGDLYMHPGADITGQAMAIGGGAYESSAAHVGGGVRAYREFTYQIARVPGGWELTYQQLETAGRPQTLQEIYGFQAPTYDRSNGLSLAIAPSLALARTGVRAEPRLTYRSQLGRLDPSVVVVDSLDRRTALRASVGRSTFSNDAWIWTDLVNGLEVLWRGHDSRNYFRATRGDLTLARSWKSSTATLEPYVGVRVEKAISVRPDSAATGGPWSFFGRREQDDMLRPNHPIDPGMTASILAGAELHWTTSDISARLRLDEELSAFSQACNGCDLHAQRNFAQTTLDGTITFPTFATQRLRVDGHAVVTSHGDVTPSQRWAYVGGSGSVPTVGMLSRGGDQLVYLDTRYDIPLDRIMLPLAGTPVVTLREVLGGAALGRFPTLAQAAGVRLTAGYLYVEWLIDPVTRRRHHSYGISIAR